ncbi:MAG TPA: aspartate ammonia-lyase, partial [Chloroflexota bacterium]|nr:aspartate ammonia-lyase [Chloroflexota bacterium]
ESLIMAAAQMIGYDTTIMVAGQAGNFELNVMLPVVAYDLLDGIALLASGARNFSRRAVEGLKATGRGPEMVEKGLMLVTALAPEIGYETAAALAKTAHATGRTIREVARERTDLSDEDLNRLLDAESMVGESG